MSYLVEFTSAAAGHIKKLPRPTRERVLDAIDDLADDERLTVTVVRAAHRREVYER